MRRLLPILLLLATATLRAQQEKPETAPAPAETTAPADKPLPDPTTLLREVEANERKFEAVEKDYTYREDSTFTELKGDGSPKKTEQRTYDIFFISGVRIARLIRKDGKDLSPDELKKENDRIDKEVAKAREKRAKADAEGKQTDSQGRDELTLSRILELGSFTDPRRILVAGRPTILVDYNGNPNAKTHNAAEGIFKSLSGTVAIDEQDKGIQHFEAHFARDDKIGGGLVAEVKAGTAVSFTAALLNGEVWLPSHIEARGRARYLLFFSFNGNFRLQASDYRKFKTSTTILPGFQKAPEDPTPGPPPP